VNNVRVRFGLRDLVWFAKNSGVFVFRTSENKATDLQDSLGRLKLLLQFAGQEKIADKLFCEYEKV
jgi:hypothetical protein